MNVHFIIATAGITVWNNRYFKDKKDEEEETKEETEKREAQNNEINELYRSCFLKFKNEKYKDFLNMYASNENNKESEIIKSLNGCIDKQNKEYEKLPSVLQEITILPVEITCIYKFIEDFASDIIKSNINEDINMYIHLISTDTFTCAAACYILQKILNGKKIKKNDILFKFIVEDAKYVDGLEIDEEKFKDASVNSLFDTLTKIRKNIEEIEGVEVTLPGEKIKSSQKKKNKKIREKLKQYMLISGVKSTIPYLTIYAQIANDIPILMSPTKNNYLKIESLPISFDSDLAEKYKFYLQNIENKHYDGLQSTTLPDEVKDELLKHNLIDNSIKITGMGKLLAKKIPSGMYGHIYANSTALWLASEKVNECSRTRNIIKSEIKYDLIDKKTGKKLDCDDKDGDLDILILSESEKKDKYNCIICECKNIYQVVGPESKITKQIGKYAQIAAIINGKSNKIKLIGGKFNKNNIFLEEYKFDFGIIDKITEFRLYIYAAEADPLLEQVDKQFEKFIESWKNEYYAENQKNLDDVEFSMHHITTYKTIDEFFGVPIESKELKNEIIAKDNKNK